MKDYLGQEYDVNDVVLWARSGGAASGDMTLGVVTKIGKTVSIARIQQRWSKYDIEYGSSRGISVVQIRSNIVKWPGPIPDGWMTLGEAREAAADG